MSTDGWSKMWAVSHGSYSDYTVDAICPTKKVAERLAARMDSEDASWSSDHFVEPIPVVNDPALAPVTVLVLTEELHDDGGSGRSTEHEDQEWPWDAYAKPVQWRWVRASYIAARGGRLEVRGTDHERVRRVFSDKRAEIRAVDALRLNTDARG